MDNQGLRGKGYQHMSQMQGAKHKVKLIQQEQFIGRTLRNGEYSIDALLGHGGMGRVFLATHTSLHIPLAIKQGLADELIPETITAELHRLLHNVNISQTTPPSAL